MTQTNTGTASATSIEINDVSPIPAGERHGKAWHLFTVWSSPNLEFATVFVGALAIGFGLNIWQGILAVVVGNGLAAITHGIFSTWGPSAGLPQMVLGRTAFGKLGNLIPSGLSTLVAGIGWFAVNTVSGTLALAALTSLDPIAALLIVIVAQVVIAFVGHNLIQVWERYTSYFLAVVWLTVLVVVFGHTGAFTVAPLADGASTDFPWAAFTLTAGAAYGYTAGWTPFASDYTRYLPASVSKRALGWFAGMGNFASTSLLMIVGVAAFNILGKDAVFSENPTKPFTESLGGFAALTLLAITIGSISANVLNVYSGAMSFLAMGFKLGFKARRAIMVAIAGVIGGITAYLAVQDGNLHDQLEHFLLVVSYWVAPWLAVVLVDRILRKGQDFTALALAKRENLAGVIAFVVSAAFSIWGFANQVAYVGPLGKALNAGDITPLVGFALAVVLYFGLAKALNAHKK